MSALFPILDAALDSAVARSADWLACRPGCHQCCVGVFPITALDAEALNAALAAADPALAARIRQRAADSRSRLATGFPGDATTGQLFTQPHHEADFDDFANDEPCPVLDPATGTCDLYAARPVQCRTFGPPIRDDEDHLTVCELNFVDAPPLAASIAEMDQSWRQLEDTLITEAEARTDQRFPTLIAFALR